MSCFATLFPLAHLIEMNALTDKQDHGMVEGVSGCCACAVGIGSTAKIDDEELMVVAVGRVEAPICCDRTNVGIGHRTLGTVSSTTAAQQL